MKYNIYLLFLGFILVQCNNTTEKNPQLLLPEETKDQYFGRTYSEPYRFLENTEDTSVINWMKFQENFTRIQLSKISNYSELLEKNEKSSGDLIKTSLLTITINEIHFYLKQDIDKQSNKLYMRNGFQGQEMLIFDPQTYKSDSGSKYLINYISPNWSGNKIAISLTKDDEELSEIVILDIVSKKLASKIIDHCLPSSLGGISWLPNNSGFIYTHIPVIDTESENFLLNTSSVLYKLGADPKKLNIIFSRKVNPDLDIKPEDFAIVYCELGINKDYLIARKGGASQYTDYYYADLSDNVTQIHWKSLFKKEDKIQWVQMFNDEFYFLTSNNAPNFKICKTSVAEPDFEQSQLVVKEDTGSVITDFTITKKGLFCIKTRNGVEVNLYRYTGSNESVLLIPKRSGRVNISSLGGESDKLWIVIQGWTHGEERYRYDFENEIFAEENLYPVKKYVELENTIIEEIEVTSHDGIKVPLSLIYKKGTKLNGKNRVLMTGYGAFGFLKRPYLGRYLFNWVAEGGVFAVAHVRGGGEKGDEWHKGGYKATKPNTWKDFIACSEYLIKNKYTSPKYFSIWSASGGGILIGRAITERPDLYAAAVIQSGVINTLRMEFGVNGKNIAKEFGTINDSIEIQYLYEMDSYQHIRKGTAYPAVLIVTGMNDSRVSPWHSTKFAARLQTSTISGKPVFLSVRFDEGHGVNSSSNQRMEGIMDLLTFALWQTGHPDYQLKDD